MLLKVAVNAMRGSRSASNTVRERCFNMAGCSSEWLLTNFENPGTILQSRCRDQFLQMQRYDIDQTRYKEVRTDHMPLYLQWGRGCKLVARFRLENETWASQRWRRDVGCRICGGADETGEHVAVCASLPVPWTRLLNERGDRGGYMQEILRRRTVTVYEALSGVNK